MASNRFEDGQYRNLCSEKTLQSNSQGFFMNFVEHFLDHVDSEWVKSVFGKLSTDQERIKFIYESNEVGKSALKKCNKKLICRHNNY